MKRWIGLLAVVWTITLGACSKPASPPESTLTASEVFGAATERSSQFHSASVAIILDQTKSTDAEEQVLMKADLTGEATLTPLKMHQAGNVSLHYPPLGMIDLDIEVYTTDESIYMHENMFDHWVKVSMDDLLHFGIQLNEKHSLATLFEQIGVYIDDFKMEQTKNTFTFTLTPTTEAFQRHIIEEMRLFHQMHFTGAQKSSEHDTVQAEQVDVSFTIDQETYDILSIDIEVYTEMMENGETTTVTTNIGAEFSNINEVKDITVPQKAIKEAVEEHPLIAQ